LSFIDYQIHNYNRVIPLTAQVRHNETWDYFASHLTDYFLDSPEGVKEVIMTDVNDLVQEFWKISSGGTVTVSFSAMRHLLEILEVRFDIVFLLRLLLTKHDQHLYRHPRQTDSTHSIANFKALIDGYQKMLDQSLIFAFSKPRGIRDLLRFLPGIVVQKSLTMQGMADLYGVNMDVLKPLIVSNIALLSSSDNYLGSRYTLTDYVGGFLQDQSRSQLCYCDPILHHISICQHFLSLIGSNPSHLKS
jgi:hypothetical protein